MAAIDKRGQTSYRLTVSCGYDKEGKKITKRKTINLDHIKPEKREAEAGKQWILFKNEVETGQYIDSGRITFEDFIDKWLKDYANNSLAQKTLLRYNILLDTRIKPALGHIRLNKLQPNHLLEFYNNLREDGIRKDGKKGGLSERTILHHHRLISSILSSAVYWQYLSNNPAERVKPPKVEKKEANHFQINQIERLFDLLEKEPIKYRTAIYIAVFGGLRLGEVCGLEWSDVNLDTKVIRVRQSSQYIDNIGTITKSPKNQSSNRLISIPEKCVAVIKTHKVWQNEERLKLGELWYDYDRIMTTFDGKPIHPGTISSWFTDFIKNFNKKVKDNEEMTEAEKKLIYLPTVTFHGLRHTNASILINQGVDVTTVSKRLGHASVSTTTDIYSHSLQKADQSAADKLEDLFNKTAPKKSNRKRKNNI